MPFSRIYEQIILKKQQRQRLFAVLLDPDNLTTAACEQLIELSHTYSIDYFLVGGSLITTQNQAPLISLLKQQSQIPVILFPSSSLHIDLQADGILLLSLISGRNPDFLIGQHVIAAPLLKASKLQILPTGYILVDSGQPTTASYMSGSMPLPRDKPNIAASTALAGELLGLHLMFLDAGSGAKNPVPAALIQAVQQAVEVPLIVGGGLNTAQKVVAALEAGADMIVIGNEIEKNPDFISTVAVAVNQFNSATLSNSY
ncbi:geranylgeranylglyceryl/heptaprenylglyceryl phosphate synthase [Adhaeribacter radiodurans]|uniref:Geranylgeranylglyceryl phosphate synthase n=1 Tax=Adhaeribacter radiodurans TaxID=2745197 RepID=A0A7L7LDU7_9BACT|nr:geranylgeranylglyceryl/heptaprenylglyceryl phosphate synthase [Adhaeribacter radiodurans]QMU31016.1 geranylgeranylglyceryl/heptaprenylglyceryl phosphate synthase [Adhaeribacter radiodurans]